MQNPIFVKIWLHISRVLSNLVFIFLFSWRKKINHEFLTEIVINRSDKIGDAIVSLPAFISLKKVLWEKLVILTSAYNDPFIKPFVKTRVINTEENVQNDWMLFDLIPDYILDKSLKKGIKQLHYKHFFPNILYSDLVVNDDYGSFSKKQMIEKIQFAFSTVFKNKINIKVEEFPKEIQTYIKWNHDLKIDEYIDRLWDFIAIYVWNKPFRNLSSEQWWWLIDWVLELNQKVLIIDDPALTISSIIQGKYRTNPKVEFLNKSYDLWSLMYLTSYAKLFIGVDWGWFNFMQLGTNSFGIYTTTSNPEIWKPFSNNKYINFGWTKNFELRKTTTSQWLIKVIYYKKNNIKMIEEIQWNNWETFQSEIVRNIDINEIIKKIQEVIIILK